MSTPRPAWAGEYGPSYEEVVKSWGLTVEHFETFGSYQGDHLAVVSGAEGIGLVVFGYGSCSGCDQLEAITPYGDDEADDWQPVVDLADQLRRDVHFEPTRDALRDWIDTHPESRWWSYDEEVASWLNRTFGSHLRADA